jgi:hypothetical protein
MAEEPGAKMKLVEGEDYYVEGGMLVFTAAYHLRRGRCCGSGCRHCPYDVTDGADVRQHEGRAVKNEE